MTEVTQEKQKSLMTPFLTFMFTLSAGVAVGSLYLAQPLLNFIAGDLHASPSSASLLVTLTQVGYAVGILFVLPLGDVRNRRKLILVMMLLAAVSLLACAVAPTFSLLLIAITAVGLTSVTGQILTPLAGDLADNKTRGKVLGTVASGVLMGILLSRTVSGFVADATGWRTIFAVTAVIDIVLAVILYRSLPELPAKQSMHYAKLIASVGKVIANERAVRWTLILGATAFGTFTMLWTALTFLLSSDPFNYSVSTIGLFGLAGLAGAIIARRAGHFHDKGHNLKVTGIAWGLAIASFALALIGGKNIVVVIIVLVLFDIAVQGINILNQSRILSISHSARSRLNTAFVTCNFVGGAIGSAIAGVLWQAGGWLAVMTAGLVLTIFGLVVWAYAQKSALRPNVKTELVTN